MDYIVYMHKLKKDNRVYIGITKQNPQKRWQNGMGYINSSYFYNAIQKYKWDSFEHIILFQKLTKEQAEEKEKELIRLYKSNIKGYGFNINEGGFAPTMTEEQKKKISNSEKGKIVSKKVAEKISKTKKEKFFYFGLTEKQKRWYERKTKKVKCIENNKIYIGQKELNKAGFNAPHIYEVCNGNRKSSGGYHWIFVKE